MIAQVVVDQTTIMTTTISSPFENNIKYYHIHRYKTYT